MSEFEYLSSELTSGDDLRAEIAAKRLVEHGKDALEVLRPLLADPSPDTRWWTIRTVGEISDNSTSELLIKALGDQDLSVRQCAALAIQNQPDRASVPALVNCMRDQDSLLTRLSANALVTIGSPAVPALLKLLEESPSLTRVEATRALALIGDQRAIPALFKALDEDSALLEYWANEGLVQMGIGMAFFNP